MNPSTPLRVARRGITAGVCLYALSVPFSVSAATGAWILLALSLLAAHWIERRRPDLRLEGIEWLFAAYVAVALLSAAQGVDFEHSLRRLRADANMLWIALLFAAAFALDPVPEALPAAAAGFAGAALFGIGRSVLFYFQHGDWIMARGTVHHITYGESMMIGLTGGVAAWVFADAPPLRGRRPWIAAYCAVVGTALLFSQARGPWLACAAALAAVAALRPETRKALAAAAAAAVAAVALAPGALAPFHDRFRSIFNPSETANAVRLTLWKLALAVFRERPLLGVGPDNFGTRLKVLHPEPYQDNNKVLTQAHNLYLHQLAERGLVGLAMLLALLGFLWWRALQRYRRAPDFRSLWLLSVLSGFWVMNLTQNSLQTATTWMTLVFLLAWTMRHEEKTPGRLP